MLIPQHTRQRQQLAVETKRAQKITGIMRQSRAFCDRISRNAVR